MATYTWEYGAAGSGLHFTVSFDDSTGEFTVKSLEGSFDFNAVWISDEDPNTGDYDLAKGDNSLNMNGSNEVWADDGTSSKEKIDWDDYGKVSSPGLGEEGTEKESFVGEGESITFSADDIGLAGFDPEAYPVLGVRATSVNGDGSIKWVDKEPEVQDDEPVYLTFDFDDELAIIAVNEDDYLDNTEDPDFHGADGDPGEDGDPDIVSASGNQNDNELEGEAGEPGNPGDPGMDAYEVVDPDPYDGIKIVSGGAGPNYILGGDGGKGGKGGDGGDASVTSTTNNANNNTVTGGEGGDGGNGGTGGHAIVNGSLSTVIIEGDAGLYILGGNVGAGGAGGDGGDASVDADNNANNNSVTGGDGGDGGDGGSGGDGGAGGDSEVVAGNQDNNNTLTNGTGGDDGDKLPVIAAFSDSVNVDASAFTGNLWISGSNDDDTFIFGVGDTVVYGTTGTDSYDVGNGDATIVYTSASQSDGTAFTDLIQSFESGDVIDLADILSGDLSFVDLGGDPLALDPNSVGWYEDGGNTHVIADVTGDGDADFQVTLEGTGLNLDFDAITQQITTVV